MNSTFGWFALFTMSNSVVHPLRFLETKLGTEVSVTWIFLNSGFLVGTHSKNGGACRDRTDDLKLAKLALSQLSYGPVVVEIVVGSGGPGKT